MTPTLVSRRLQLVPLLITLALALGAVRPVAGNGCGSDLEGCFYRAALVDNWLDRWLAGIDCEMAFAGCIADALSR
jgi:hypothetical protein